jgi:hypothetical protein
MFVALHWKTLKSSLPYMPAAAVMLVITPYVTGQKPLHESAQRLVMRSFNHKVKVGHQASGNLLIFLWTSDFPTSSLSRLQRLERSAAIERLERLEQAQAKIVLSFISSRRIRERPITRRPIANAPIASAPIAKAPKASAPTACAPIISA